MNIKLTADDNIVVAYLESLWKSSRNQRKRRFDNNTFITNKKRRTINSDKLFFKDYIEHTINDILNQVICDLTVNNIKVDDNKLKQLQRLGFEVYNNIQLEDEVEMDGNNINVNEVYSFIKGTRIMKSQILKNISYSKILPKYKYGPTNDPYNFRYLINHHNTIKVLDRILCYNIIDSIKNNGPDKNIYISNFNKFSDNDNSNKETLYYANINTLSTNNIVLIDILKAYDSLEWDDIEDLLLTNLTRKSNSTIANELVTKYLIILKNRELYYNKIKVKIEKGIPTGLPSSTLVFLLCIEEIITRWLKKYKYTTNDFILNIFVDDIYIKMINIKEANNIISSLIDYLLNYNLKININKCKADLILGLNFKPILETDCYLGIPFTRNITKYSSIILDEYYKKHNFKMSWLDIYNELKNNKTENYKHYFGYFNYKLKPLLKYNNIESNQQNMLYFIKKNFFTWSEYFIYLFFTLSEYFIYLFQSLFSYMKSYIITN